MSNPAASTQTKVLRWHILWNHRNDSSSQTCSVVALVWSLKWMDSDADRKALSGQCGVLNDRRCDVTYCELLLWFVVLVEIHASSAEVSHGITGQKFSDTRTKYKLCINMHVKIYHANTMVSLEEILQVLQNQLSFVLYTNNDLAVCTVSIT